MDDSRTILTAHRTGALRRALARMIRLQGSIAARVPPLARRRGRDADVRRICVFAAVGNPRNPEVPGLGDLLTRNIVLALLARRYPHATLTLVAGGRLLRRFRETLLGHMRLDDLVECPEPDEQSTWKWLAFVTAVRRRRFDLCVIDPASSVRVFHACLCGIPSRMGIPVGPGERDLMTRPVAVHPASGTRPDLFDVAVGYASALGLPEPFTADRLRPGFRIADEPVLNPTGGGPVVAMHVGGGRGWNRRWPLARYAELCRRLSMDLGARVFLLGGAEERDAHRQLIADVRRGAPDADVHDVSGVPLNRTASYLQAASLFIGNDSSLLHVAGALGIPMVIVVGPFDSGIWARMYPHALIVSHPSACRALSSFSVRRHYERRHSCVEHACPYAFDARTPVYPRCLTDVSVDAVWTAVRTRIGVPREAGVVPAT